MGIFPKWLAEFPSSFIETYKEAIASNWPEFKEEVSTGIKTIVGGVSSGTQTIVRGVLGGFTPSLIIVAVILVLALVLWKRIFK